MRLLSEPLLHFLLLGAGLFVLYGWIGGDGRDAGDRRVVVSAAEVEQIATLFAKRWGRPPTAAELRGSIDARVREEVLYREALRYGLDRDDTVVRRRMAQKMEFMFEDVGALLEPTREDLEALRREDAERFSEPARMTLDQVYLSADRRGDAVADDARALLETLRRDAPDGGAGAYGDPLALSTRYEDASTRELDRLFGSGFGDAVAALEPGAWSGPIESGYGLHLVFVHERHDARLPPLEEIERRVADEWRSRKRDEANEAAVAELMERYEILVEAPE